MKSLQIGLIFISFSWLIGCANVGEDPSKQDPASKGTQPKGDESTNQNADAKPANQGDILISLADAKFTESLEAYIVGLADSHKASLASSDGASHVITKMGAGTYDLILTAVDPDTLGQAIPDIFGLRINGLRVREDRGLRLSNLNLEPSHTIRGRMQGHTSPLSGVEIRIDGTSLHAISDSDGNYEIRGVPVGLHRIVATKEGFHGGRLEKFRLSDTADAGSPFQLPELTLWQETEVSGPGITSLASQATPADKLEVSFFLIAPETANQMRIGEQSDLSNQPWQALQSTFDYTFTSPGNKTLYVQVSKDGSQLSQIFTRQLSIQLPAEP